MKIERPQVKDRLLATRVGTSVLDYVDALTERSFTQSESLATLYNLLQPSVPLPSMRGWAISADLALEFATQALDDRVQTAVEFGSGTSSVIAGLCFAKRGTGRLISFDHDATWAERTRADLERHGVGDLVDIRVVPLVDWGPAIEPRRNDARGVRQVWYDVHDLPDEVDLVLVDGPPHATCPHARYPALNVMAPHLAPGAVVLLDDVRRREERTIVERWTEAFPRVHVEYLPLRKEAARLTWPHGRVQTGASR